MITLLLPIGKFSVFAELCLENIIYTCGNNKELDFVFLTSKTIPPNLDKKFNKLANKHNFRVVSAPIESDIHLELIDWAFYEGITNEWVILQHCDVFWFCKNWINDIIKIIKENPEAICIRHNWKTSPFKTACGEFVPLLHDFFGVYKKTPIVKNGYKFAWGTWGKPINFSVSATREIKKANVVWTSPGKRSKNSSKLITNKDWIDGSEALSIEFFVNHKNKVINSPFKEFLTDDRDDADFIHFWEMFRMHHRFYLEGDTIKFHPSIFWTNPFVELNTFDKRKKFGMFAIYSYLSTFMIDKSEIYGKVIPWDLFEKTSNSDENWARELREWKDKIIVPLFGYKINPDKIDTSNIKKILFNNLTIL